MPNTQAGKFISVTTPLGDDVLLLRKFAGQEGISQLFNFQMELASEKSGLRLESLIGQNITVNMTSSDGNIRYFNGFVSEFARTGQDSEVTYYSAEMMPWLWFLSQTSDFRIFQNKTIPEIVTQIFQEFGFRDFRTALQGAYERHDVVVQYNESKFDFISRLLEQTGIFYFFEHTQGKHTLVMGDRPGAHPVLPVTPNVQYRPGDGSGAVNGAITSLAAKREWRPGKYAMSDYNFEIPSTDLEVAVLSRSEVGATDVTSCTSIRVIIDRKRRARRWLASACKKSNRCPRS